MWFVEPPEEALEIVPEVVVNESALDDDPIPDFSDTTSDAPSEGADIDTGDDAGDDTGTDADAAVAPALVGDEDGVEEPSPAPTADEDTAADPAEDAIAARRARRLELKTVRSNLPALPRSRSRSRALVAGWVAYAAAMLILVLTPIFARAWISEVWPPITHLYSVLGAEDGGDKHSGDSKGGADERGLHPIEFMAFDYPFSTSRVDNVATLTVNVIAKNNGTVSVVLPEFKGRLLDAAGNELHVWTFSAGGNSVAPGSEASFQTTVSPMPEGTAEMDIGPQWPD